MFKKLALAALFCVVSLPFTLPAQTLFVGSGDGFSPTVYGFRGDPFTGPSAFVGTTSVLQAFPAGNRYWVFSKNTIGTVSVVDAATFGLIRTFNLGQAPGALAQTPDGRKILVLNIGLRVFDGLLDTELPVISGDLGINPVDVAASFDSRRAFVLSTTSQRITIVDLDTYTTTGVPVTVPGIPTAIATGPNGLVYVSGQNAVWEYLYDPGSNALILRSQMTFNGYIGKLQFSPDGTRAAALNLSPSVASPESVFLFDLANRTFLGGVPQLPGVPNKVVMPDATRCFALVPALQKLYQISLANPGFPTEAAFSGLPALTGVRDIATSIEVPANRYLFIGADVYLYRVDLTTNALSGQIGIAGNRVGDIAAALPTTTGVAANLVARNANQTIGVGATPAPLLVTVVDFSGKPVANAQVSFTAFSGGVVVANPVVTTGLNGVAGTLVSVPAVTGVYQVTASVVGVGATATFTINVSTTTGGGGGVAYGLQIWAGHGQVIGPNTSTSGPGQERLRVRYVDAAGNPVPGVTVTWTVTDTQFTTGTVAPAASVTDLNGFAEADYFAGPVTGGLTLGNPVGTTTITASAFGQTVVFNLITVANPVLGNNFPGFITVRVTPIERRITVKAGATATGAISVQVFANGAYPLSGVSVRLVSDLDTAPTRPSLCGGGIVLTDSSGSATCDVAAGGVQGVQPHTLIVGGTQRVAFAIEVTPGLPAGVQDVRGNNQRGRVGQRLPIALSAQVVDAFGNLVEPGSKVTWEVPVAGSATLSNVVDTVDSSGRVSAIVTLGSRPGTVQVNLRTGNNVFTFTLTAEVSIGQVAAVSGDGQTAEINKPFAQPLVVRVTDAQGAPVSNFDVRFEVISGSATLSAPTGTTNAEGQAQVSVTAGGSAGPITIRAVVEGQPAVTFNLTARLPGPVLDLRQIVNAAGFQQGIAPGSLVTIYGAGIAPNLKGAVVANAFGFGPLPTKLAEVEVLFGNLQAPILSVANINNQESVTVQVPFELAAPASTTLTVRVSGGSTMLNNVPIQPVNPGIFETVDEGGRRYAIIAKEDGSFVSPSNPARKTEKLRMFLTGLGPATPTAFTNRTGVAGQTAFLPVIVGVKDEGLDAPFTVALSPTMIGVWEITFQLNQTTPSGQQIKLSVSVTGSDGVRYFSNNSAIAAVN